VPFFVAGGKNNKNLLFQVEEARPAVSCFFTFLYFKLANFLHILIKALPVIAESFPKEPSIALMKKWASLVSYFTSL
jgi:hypothetical protein